MQFRLTQKYAADCRISHLLTPCDTLHPLDDWFIDVIRVRRKKVSMVTHAKSAYTLFIPYAEAGGAKGISQHIKVPLEKFLYRHDLSVHIKQVEQLFNSTPVFCKTVDRKILGHMNDFKRCAGYMLERDPPDFERAEQMISHPPLTLDLKGCTYPLQRMGLLLGRDLRVDYCF